MTVLRLLHLKNIMPEAFEKLMRLEDHNELRMEEEDELWKYHQEHVVRFLKEVTMNN